MVAFLVLENIKLNVRVYCTVINMTLKTKPLENITGLEQLGKCHLQHFCCLILCNCFLNNIDGFIHQQQCCRLYVFILKRWKLIKKKRCCRTTIHYDDCGNQWKNPLEIYMFIGCSFVFCVWNHSWQNTKEKCKPDVKQYLLHRKWSKSLLYANFWRHYLHCSLCVLEVCSCFSCVLHPKSMCQYIANIFSSWWESQISILVWKVISVLNILIWKG